MVFCLMFDWNVYLVVIVVVVLFDESYWINLGVWWFSIMIVVCGLWLVIDGRIDLFIIYRFLMLWIWYFGLMMVCGLLLVFIGVLLYRCCDVVYMVGLMCVVVLYNLWVNVLFWCRVVILVGLLLYWCLMWIGIWGLFEINVMCLCVCGCMSVILICG